MSSRLRAMQEVVNGKSSCRTCDHKMFFINFTELPFLPYHSLIEGCTFIYVQLCRVHRMGNWKANGSGWDMDYTAELNGVRRRTAIKSREL